MQNGKNNQVVLGDFQGFGIASEETAGKPRKEEKSNAAESKMQKGQSMIFAGFAFAIVGIIFYCSSMFAMDETTKEISQLSFQTWVGLGTIGIGILLWLVGNILHLNGLMDLGPGESKGTESQ